MRKGVSGFVITHSCAYRRPYSMSHSLFPYLSNDLTLILAHCAHWRTLRCMYLQLKLADFGLARSVVSCHGLDRNLDLSVNVSTRFS